MKRMALSLSFVLAATAANAENLKVVSSFSILGDLTSQVGGDKIDHSVLVGAGEDAHVFQPTPQDAKTLAAADVVIINGLEFEGWLERLIEASGFDGEIVTVSSHIEPIAFGEDDHDDHGDEEHAGHDDHGHGEEEHADHDDHGHGHGDHGFEWGGLFNLEAGTYNWSFAKVDGDYADPAMKMVILAADDLEAVEEDAEGLLEADTAGSKSDGDTLSAANMAYSLTFDASKEMTVFSVEISEAGTYAFFTEHMPFEFEANEHFFKDIAGADVEPIAQEPEMEHGHDHHGHDHGEFDPHAWQDPELAAHYVEEITEALAEADATNAAFFKANGEALEAALIALDAEITAAFEGIPEDSRIVITSHDAFQYYGEAYGIEFLAPIGLGTEEQPSAKEVADLITQIRERGVTALFVENITDTRLIEQIASETGAEVGGTLFSDALSDANGPASTYQDMMRHNTKLIVDALTSGT
ncbi:MAG: zinc ABC transporter substrate-binding protein [Pseudomonadota bacterium]